MALQGYAQLPPPAGAKPSTQQKLFVGSSLSPVPPVISSVGRTNVAPVPPGGTSLRQSATSETEHLKPYPKIQMNKEEVEKPPGKNKIKAMGLEDDYEEFAERYMAGVGNSHLTKKDFGNWYPNVHAWKWRRTISFWIGITFFEGSIFFTVSSFLYNCPEALGEYKKAMTFYGYLAGKVHFLICTYLMCIETINLSTAHHKGDVDDDGEDEDLSSDEEREEQIRWNPFACRRALSNLEAMGAGPWPYYASLIYFTGVLTFTVGFAAEMIPGIPEEIMEQVVAWAFLLGSFQFLIGGAAECVENEVFTKPCRLSIGPIGAFLNLLGGLLFQVGSMHPFFPSLVSSFWSNILWGIGSSFFLFGSSVMLIMWRDEQYGLTFLAVINKLGGPHGKPLVARGDEPVHEQASFSMWGIFFIHLYCVAGAASTYNFMVEVTNWHLSGESHFRNLQLAFNELMPGIIAHMTIALRSAVVRTPQASPYLQLFGFLRVLAIIMTASSVYTFIEVLRQKIII